MAASLRAMSCTICTELLVTPNTVSHHLTSEPQKLHTNICCVLNVSLLLQILLLYIQTGPLIVAVKGTEYLVVTGDWNAVIGENVNEKMHW